MASWSPSCARSLFFSDKEVRHHQSRQTFVSGIDPDNPGMAAGNRSMRVEAVTEQVFRMAIQSSMA
jgi:hypothetical protein